MNIFLYEKFICSFHRIITKMILCLFHKCKIFMYIREKKNELIHDSNALLRCDTSVFINKEDTMHPPVMSAGDL